MRFSENTDSFKKCNLMYSQISHKTQHALLILDMIAKFNKVFLRETKQDRSLEHPFNMTDASELQGKLL